MLGGLQLWYVLLYNKLCIAFIKNCGLPLINKTGTQLIMHM